MQDRYPEAAVRHYLDGVILQQAHRYNNAMCHYAFSAECSIKAFNEQFRLIYPLCKLKSHNVTSILESMVEYHELLGILSPKLSLLIGIGTTPDILFHEHPDRRYKNDINYTDNNLVVCETFAGRLVWKVIAAAIDGQLEYESKRGAL